MNTRQLGPCVLLLATLSWVAACGGPPKQAEAPDVDKESSVDMAAPADEGQAGAASAGTAPEENMREKCCAECKAGAAKDRSGAAKSSIPCADLTADLSPWCLEHFRANAAMASECR